VLKRDTKFWEVQKYITTPLHAMGGPDPGHRDVVRQDDPVPAMIDRQALESAEYEWKWSEQEEAGP
jgi:hypothetical protein